MLIHSGLNAGKLIEDLEARICSVREKSMVFNTRLRRARLIEAAQGYLELEMADHAVKQLQAIDDPGECTLDVNRLWGEALRAKREYCAALQAFGRALQEEPTDLSILCGMAWCYKRTGELPQAIATMEQAYRCCPDEPIVLYNLSCYFALAGNKTQSLSWLGRALRMSGTLRDCLPGETDFDRFRDDPDFQFIAGTRGSDLCRGA